LIREAINIVRRPSFVLLLLINKLPTTTNANIRISKLARSIKNADIGDIKIENTMKFSKTDLAPSLMWIRTRVLSIKIKKRKPMTSALSKLIPKTWRKRMSENP
jgi:hypothetical protein